MIIHTDIWDRGKDFHGYKVLENGRAFKFMKGEVYWREIMPIFYKRGKCFRFNMTISGERKTFRRSRLVADLFIPKPEGKVRVKHINGNTYDDHVNNLMWVKGW